MQKQALLGSAAIVTKAFAVVSSIAAAALLTPSPVRAQMFNLAQTFNNPTPASSDFFGDSVAISGNNALIGASGDDTDGDNAGSAYLFDITTGTCCRPSTTRLPEATTASASPWRSAATMP